MGLWMSKHTVLSRLAEDPAAPIMARVRALEQIEHPELAMLRRLLVDSKTPREKPVPAKVRALASLKYAREIELRRLRKLAKTKSAETNALGI